jgi:hypothetical protein
MKILSLHICKLFNTRKPISKGENFMHKNIISNFHSSEKAEIA